MTARIVRTPDPRPRAVGIDPGQNGAAVAVGADGATVIAVQTWRHAKVPPRIEILHPQDVVALEAQHVGGPHASLVLSEWCGRMLATLPSGITVLRPLATSWRAKVFRDGRLQRIPAKRRAVAAATPFLQAFDPGLRITHDLAEAWCLARFAAFCPVEDEVTTP